MRKSDLRIGTALVCALFLAACSGGGATLPTGVVSPAQPPQSMGHASMTLSFSVAGTQSTNAKKRPAYVSTLSTQAVVTITSVDGSAPASSIQPNPLTVSFVTSGAGENCTVSGGVETCTFDVLAPAGSVTYKLDVEDGAGHVLSTGTQTFTILSGVANRLFLTLDAAPAAVTITGPTLTAGTAVTAGALTVAVADPAGGSIPASPAQTFTTPITITDSDATGATSLLLNSTTGTGTSSVQLTQSSDIVYVTYTGRGVPPFTLTASGTGVSGSLQYSVANSNLVYQPIALSGTTTCDASHGCSSSDANYNQPTLFINSAGGTAVFGASETGWSDFSQNFTVTLDSASCNGVATLSGSPGTSFTATGVAAGVCKATVADGLGQTAAAYISVTTTGIGVI